MQKLKKLNNAQERDERFDNTFVGKFEYFLGVFPTWLLCKVFKMGFSSSKSKWSEVIVGS